LRFDGFVFVVVVVVVLLTVKGFVTISATAPSTVITRAALRLRSEPAT
jgi:hypothetical protein